MTTLKVLHKRIAKWCSTPENRLLIAEWIVKAISYYLGFGGLLALPFKIYRYCQNDENNKLILIKNTLNMISL